MKRDKIGNLLLKFHRKVKIPQTEYLAEGETPIVDQSSDSWIAGYTDNPDARHESPLPITVFGDHTRVVKYANFPFASGADGTQLIYPNTEELDPTYFYYAVKNVDLSNYFYARHFKFLKEQEINLPKPDDQRRIAETLRAYDELLENNRRRMALLEEAARQLYAEWFVRLRYPGHARTRRSETLPDRWEKCGVSEFGDVITGKTPSTKESDNYGGEIPFIKTPDMHGNVFVVETEATLTEKGANTQSGKFLPPKVLLVSCIGTIGVVSLNSARSQFNQQINAVVPFEDAYRYYCYFAFKSLKEEMEAIGGGVTMANVSKSKFEGLQVMKPPMTLLREFHNFCAPLFQQIEVLTFQNQKLRAARDLLLPRLMSGEIAV